MNLNENPDELKKEEQSILNDLIFKMDGVIESLDIRMREYVAEAKNADISINPDLYLTQIMAQQGIKDTAENREKMLQARDELYHTRLLLHYDCAGQEGIEEVKIGLHSCMHGAERFVTSWKMPLCRHYILDNASTDFENIVKKEHGEEYRTKYKLLVKNQVKLRFTRVIKAMNMYPGIFDDQALNMIKGKGFFSEAFLDEMIKKYNLEDYDPDSAAKIISDEFLQELLERKSTPEFKNIVFSIQKKQGEIIQAPYRRNMIVQGCAGSGKSMIMLHRLPILLYDNPNSLSRTNLYIITPSQMYIQLAENMRHQLEISDINMGTIEQYYDMCIGKYPGHKAGEYGKVSYTSKLSKENESYVYSSRCIDDINDYFGRLSDNTDTSVSLKKAYDELNLKEKERKTENTFAQRMGNRLSRIQSVLTANNESVGKYYNRMRNALDSLQALSATLRYRKERTHREIARMISKSEEEIRQAQKKLEEPDVKEKTIENCKNIIDIASKRIVRLNDERSDIDADMDYFQSLYDVSEKIESVLDPFKTIKNGFNPNAMKDIYDAIENIGQLIDGFFMVSKELSNIEDKYFTYVGAFSRDIDKAQRSVTVLKEIKEKYLEYGYYSQIREERDILSDEITNAIKNAYELIMSKLGVKPSEKGNMKVLKCSPYIYLQVIYQFQGVPSGSKESLLAIDEAQGIAPEEIRLLKNINGGSVVFNLYGDIYQHIEGTKGVESWDEYREVLDFDVYKMQENYRNASQITEYCNKKFGMDMIAINTPGKGVHEMYDEAEFCNEMITQLMDNQRAGLSAILVANDAEARYLLGEFEAYEQKIHNMTDEGFNIHGTRWNIINIDDAKGLEFSSVIVLSGRMSRNQRYIAYTRALDDLYVYSEVINVKKYEKKTRKKQEEADDEKNDGGRDKDLAEHNSEIKIQGNPSAKHTFSRSVKDHSDSELRRYFEENGLEVIDKRDDGGRLWVLGEKAAIRDVVNIAISKFSISGKYASSKETRNRNGWYTKSDK